MNEQTSEILALISHEFRTPLAVIKGYTTTLLRHDTHLSRSERREYLTIVNHATDRLEDLIKRLLLIYRERNTDQHDLVRDDYTLLDLAQIAREEIEHAQRTDTGRQFAFLFDNQTDDYAAVIVRANPVSIHETVGHLLENAMKYSPPGSKIVVTLTSGTNHAPEGGHTTPYVRLAVRDHGIGISAEDLPRIFDPFFRVERGLVQEVSGMGIGLTYCQSIIERYHGRIWAESEPHKGTTMTFELPCAQPDIVGAGGLTQSVAID